MNKLAVFKTQDASQIEGGVAGQIQMETIKPLDYGKRRIQVDLKGNFNPDQLDQMDTEAGDFGYRATGSYTDQFSVGGGDIGFSIGVQRSDISQPEAESRQTGPTSNSRPACLITDGLIQYTDQVNGGTFTGFSNNPETRDRGDDDCDDFNDRREASNLDQRGSDVEGVDTSFDENGIPIDNLTPFAFAPSQRHFRQNDTRDQRDAIFGAFQWQPNEVMDINLDVQWSERLQSERRNDLTFNGGRRNDTSLNIGPNGSTTTLDSMVVSPTGAILRSITDNSIEVQGGDWQREETYLGGGLNIGYDVSERLSVSADVGYSKTERTEQAIEFRIQSDISPVIEFDRTGGRNVPLYTLYDEEFDVNNYDNYVDRLRVRIDNDVYRDNEILSGRFDANYDLGGGLLKNLQAGVRWSEQNYLELPGGSDSGNPLDANIGRFSFEIENDGELTVNNREVLDDNNDSGVAGAQQAALEDQLVAIIGAANAACRTDFPEGNSFLSSQRDGDLVTNIGDDGSVLSSTNTWATFDATCMATTAVDSLNSILAAINAYSLNPDARENSFGGALGDFSALAPALIRESSRTIDVQETTQSVYLMSDYETTIDGLPFSGNFGVRLVHTDVEATGYRPTLVVGGTEGAFTVSQTDPQFVSTSHDYTRLLPSITGILELSEDKLLRLGAFRAMSRADPADMGYGRNFTSLVGDDEESVTLEEAIGRVSGNGNPLQNPLMSWNFDVGVEWYPDSDSIVAVSTYIKSFQGGFNNVVQNESFSIDGRDVVLPVEGIVQTSDQKSTLAGFEFTGAHRFSYLPGFLSGMGAKVSYNYVDSNFEFEDSRYGDIFVTDENGNVTQTNRGIIAPASLAGLSKHTLSAQAYYQTGDFDMQVNYKYRDDYFQPFVSDGTRIRYVGDVGVWEARASYQFNDNFRLTAEVINLLSAPKEQFAFVRDDLYEVNDCGPRVFFGVRGKF